MNRRDFISSSSGALVVAFALPVVLRAATPAGKNPFKDLPPFEGKAPLAIDSWLQIDKAGQVTLFTGKVELGTGVQTALGQLVADELDVPFAKVKLVMGDTARCPYQFATVGSLTILLAGPQIRNAAAQARLALLDMAAAKLQVAADSLTTRDGVVSSRDQRSISYAELVGGQRFERELAGKPALKSPAQMRVIGKPVPRVELPGKVFGTHTYIQDLRVPEMVHGRIVRSALAGAKLVRVDDSALASMPGRPRVVVSGNIVGVVADDEFHLGRAIDALKVEWRDARDLPSPAALQETLRQAPATSDVLVSSGDAAAALSSSKKVHRATYFVPHQLHASIGPSCAIAHVADGKATLWSSTQMSFELRDSVAEILRLPPTSVRLIWIEGSGCYGQNGSDDCTADAAVLSQLTGKPVRVQWTRRDESTCEPRGPAMLVDVSAALSSQQQIAAWDYRVWSPNHANARAFAGGNLLVGEQLGLEPLWAKAGAERNANHQYAVPDMRVTVHVLHASPVRTSSLRGLGSPQNSFANESFMDELAHEAGVDPIEFRIKHLRDERSIAVLKEVARISGWSTRQPSKRTGVGHGAAYVQYKNSSAYVAMVARVAVDRDSGKVKLSRVWVAHDCGLIVNPDGVRNQIEGNIIQTASRALLEEAGYTPQGMSSVDWSTYPIMRFDDVPEAIDISLIDRPESPALGAGEPASSPVFPAIANAIYDAIGVRVRNAPFTPERIKAALGA